MPIPVCRWRPALCASLLLAPALALPDSASDQPAANRRNPPGWGLAQKVCEPEQFATHRSVVKGPGRSDIPTGFYRISRMPDAGAGFLDVGDDESPEGQTVLLRVSPKDSARAWLVSEVGRALLQISTCVQGQPRCLVLEPSSRNHGSAQLGVCDFEAVGTAAWWVKGYLHEPVKGGFELGSDGIGQLSCLGVDAQGVPQLDPCPDERKTAWRFEAVAAPAAKLAALPAPKASVSVAVAEAKPEASVAASSANGLYVCENGSEVTVEQRDPKDDVIRVRYKNQWQTLRPAISASGARYVGKTLEWWTKGESEGLLLRHQKDGTSGELITRCSRPDSAAQVLAPTRD